jgi:hypothetical protein
MEQRAEWTARMQADAHGPDRTFLCRGTCDLLSPQRVGPGASGWPDAQAALRHSVYNPSPLASRFLYPADGQPDHAYLRWSFVSNAHTA